LIVLSQATSDMMLGL